MIRLSAGSLLRWRLRKTSRWTSATVLCVALGLTSAGVADAGSRQGYSASYGLFWLALLMIYVPVAFAVLRRDADRGERLTLVVLLGVALYLVKALAAPTAFEFTDEFIHLRSTQDILRSDHLFQFNPLLPTAPYYPGLAAVTAGFVDLTGLSPFAAGMLMIGAARILFSGCFFLVAEKVTGSARVAAAASLVYVANPMFLFWGAAFSYENLALPLAVFVVWWLGSTRHQPDRPAQIATAIAIVAVCVTHHVVGFALTALLGAWWLAEHLLQRGKEPVVANEGRRNSLAFMTIVAGATSLGWLLLVAGPAASYLFTDNILPALQQTISVLLGQIPLRRLYSSGGYASPEWEIIAGFVAVGLLLLALPPAIYLAWRRRAYAPMLLAIGVAAAYPLSLAPRLAPNGVAISGRLSEYVFAGLACVVGLLVGEAWRWPWKRGEQPQRSAAGWHRAGSFAGLATLVFVGNVTVGTAFYERLPESSDPRGYPWSVQTDVINASSWARVHLGINQPFGANATDALALATYGEQTTAGQNVAWPIFFAEDFNAAVVDQIKAAGIRYLLVNWRMTEGVPPTPGYYFSPQEPHAAEYKEIFPAAALQKFDSTSCAKLVYDSGSVKIFDISQIQSGMCVPAHSSPSAHRRPTA